MPREVANWDEALHPRQVLHFWNRTPTTQVLFFRFCQKQNFTPTKFQKLKQEGNVLCQVYKRLFWNIHIEVPCLSFSYFDE
jgi:hypothetical protein